MISIQNPFAAFASCILISFLIGSCGSSARNSGYVEKIDAWHQNRLESLKEEDGWLSLAGLYRLETGSSSFGADSSNDIVFPGGKAPAEIGQLTVSGDDRISVRINQGVDVRSEGVPVSDTTLKSDAEGPPTILTHGPLEWYVIERGGKLFLRLKDNEHPSLASFSGIERFPVSREWRIEARFIEFEQPDSIGIPNVLGQVNMEPQHGVLEFEMEGETYTLSPLGDPESEEFFIIFGDRTNGEETYGGGRFVYSDTPNERGITHIDFNRAYNPPCVFTPFATCPLPPSENRLEVEIRAGEKDYRAGSGH